MAPIAKALGGRGVSVTIAPAHSRHLATQFGWSDFETVVAAVEREGFKATGPDKTAEVIVCTFPTQNLRSFYSGITVRMQYGVGLVDPKSDHPMGEASDYYLVHGPFGVRTQFTMHGMPSPLIPWERVKVIGYPKLDGYFQNLHSYSCASCTHPPMPEAQACTFGDECNIRKYFFKDAPRRILWLPTWSVRSSIDRHIDSIDALQSDRYRVWVKPHHCTERWETERMERLSRFSMISATAPTAAVLQPTDLVLADLSSGAFTEALLIGKPVVGLSSKEERAHLLLDNDALLPGVTGPEFLRKEIEYIKHFMWDSEALETLRDDLFTTTRGHDAEVAAKTILELR